MFINAMGHYVPAGRVDNDYFFNINGLTSEWILQRTGIKTRSKAGENEDANTMGLQATREAVSKLPYDVTDVDLVVCACYSPIDTVGTLAHIAQREYNMGKAKAVYVSSACSSFANGLEIVEGYFALGKATKALVICSEHNTNYSNEADPKTGHLWGDAAVAMFVSKEEQVAGEPQILEVFTRGLGHIGHGPEGVSLKPKTDGITMPYGKDVFVHACKFMCEVLDTMTAHNGLAIADLSYIICHQANLRIVANIQHQLSVDPARFLNNIEELGNTGSASSVLVLSQNVDRMRKGDLVALTVFGGGYSSGGFLIRF